jgi:hypothetical protein
MMALLLLLPDHFFQLGQDCCPAPAGCALVAQHLETSQRAASSIARMLHTVRREARNKTSLPVHAAT